MLSEKVRAYIYRLTLVALPLLTAYGVVSDQQAALVAGLVAAILNVGLATFNTSTKAA